MLILQTCHTHFWPKTEMKQHWPPRTPVKYVSGSKVPCNKAWSPCKQTQRTYVSQKLAPRSLNKKLRSLDSFEVVLLGMVPPPEVFSTTYSSDLKNYAPFLLGLALTKWPPSTEKPLCWWMENDDISNKIPKKPKSLFLFIFPRKP